MRESEKRGRTYAIKFFNSDAEWYPALAGYIAGFERGRIVERKKTWAKAAVYFARHPEKLPPVE